MTRHVAHTRLANAGSGRAVNLHGRRRPPAHEGFTLVEALVAMGIMAFGALALGAVMALSMQHVSTSQSDVIAKEKAAEAVESVYTARDTRTLTWAQIRNVSGNGVFLDGDQPLLEAGPDGMANTADDAGVQSVRLPGNDDILGNTDDVLLALNAFTRRVQIIDLNANLREIRVTVTYQVGSFRRQYVLTTYISSFA